MPEIVRMPKMSDTMTEGAVTKWHKKIGDTVKAGDLLAEIETDKATMEFESYNEGILLYIGVPEGKTALVNDILAIFGKAGEDYKPLLEKEKKNSEMNKPDLKSPSKKSDVSIVGKTEPPTPSVAPITSKHPVNLTNTPRSSSAIDSRTKASPLAERLASEKGIDIAKIMGTGPSGRIVKRDIDWFKPGSFVSSSGTSFAEAVTEERFDEVTVSQMRKTIARRLAESKFTAPHFYLTVEIDMEACVMARETINAATGSKISYNDLVIKAAAAALRMHPKVNSSWLGEKIRINHHVHIGVAVAVEDGLLVPVVRFADSKSLRHINSEVKELAQKAKDKKLQPSDWEGSTFTISNLGMYGIEEFTAIINPPDACIMAVGGIMEKPVVRNGAVVPGKVMKVTMSCDHRAVDGATGSEFLRTLKGLMENPVILLGQGSI